MRNQYKVLAEKYQAINEDLAKIGFDHFAEVYGKINKTVETLDKLYKEYNEEIEPIQTSFAGPALYADAIKSFKTAFIKKHNLEEYFEAILEGINLLRWEKHETLLNLYGAIFFHITDRVHVRKWVTAMLINKAYVEWLDV